MSPPFLKTFGGDLGGGVEPNQVLDASQPTVLTLPDFCMQVDTNGRVLPHMLADIQHRNYLEAETFYGLATLPAGSFPAAQPVDMVLFFQLAYSTLGPTPSCQVSAKIHVPGVVHETLSVNVSASRNYESQHTPQSSRITIHPCAESSLQASIVKSFVNQTITLRLLSPEHNLDLSLTLHTAPRGYALNGGKIYYYGGSQNPFSSVHTRGPGYLSTAPPPHHKADGYVLEHFLPVPRFSGVVRVGERVVTVPSGLGAGLFTHAVQAIKPHVAARRWTVFLLYDHAKRALLHAVQWKTPAMYGEVEVMQGALVVDGMVQAVVGGPGNSVQEVLNGVDPVSGYVLPRELHFHWCAPNMMASSSVSLTKLLGCYDVLENLPYWLRVVIQRFITRPYIYQWLQRTTAHVQMVNGTGRHAELHGPAMLECAYLG